VTNEGHDENEGEMKVNKYIGIESTKKERVTKRDERMRGRNRHNS
jgi:hypothetical protein